MKPSEPAKTLFKVRATKRVREYWLMTKILVWFGWSVCCFAFAQCSLCRYEHPKMTARECLVPRMAKK
jgi:hypothetical protein